MIVMHLDPPAEGGALKPDENPSPKPECGNPYALAPEATVSREEIDRYFDRDMAGAERTDFLSALRSDSRAAREVAMTREVLARLDEPVVAPDMTSAVLRRVGRARGFLGRRQRRVVTAGRASVLLGAMLTFAIVLMAREQNPDLDLTPAPMPVSRVVEAGRSGLAELALPGGFRQVEHRQVRVGARMPDCVSMPLDLRWSVEPTSVMRVSHAPDALAVAIDVGDEVPAVRGVDGQRSCWFVVVDGSPVTAADLSRGQWRGTMWINTVPLPRTDADAPFDR